MAFINIGQVVYPVGSYFMSTKSISPASLFGGSWTEINNRYLAAKGANLLLGTGGSFYISQNQLPKISGTLQPHGNEKGSNFWNPTGVFSQSKMQSFYWETEGITQNTAQSCNMINFNLGNGQAYYPPFQSCYMWYRTA